VEWWDLMKNDEFERALIEAIVVKPGFTLYMDVIKKITKILNLGSLSLCRILNLGHSEYEIRVQVMDVCGL
jgi:hypothetical protein